MSNTIELNIPHLFHTLTNHQPYNFQTKTIARIFNGEDIIIKAPTGSGKTETAVAPFLFAKSLSIDFPSKLIYVVPLRTLANSLRQRVEVLVANWENAYPTSRSLVVTLQTGENPEDARFEGDIIFCTIDQMLSSFLNWEYLEIHQPQSKILCCYKSKLNYAGRRSSSIVYVVAMQEARQRLLVTSS
jgi:ATP-dependent helicase YprA (DUF1998 family)